MTSIRCLCVAAVLLAVPVLASAQRLMLAGDNQMVWLIAPAVDGKGAQIFARPMGGSWAPVGNLGSMPAAAAAMGGRLQLMFDRPFRHVVYRIESGELTSSDLPVPSLAAWPSGVAPLAMFQGPTAGKAGESLIAIVERTTPATMPASTSSTSESAPASAPASSRLERIISGAAAEEEPADSQPATSRATLLGPLRHVTLAVFERREGDWKLIAQIRDVTISDQCEVMGAMLGDTPYVLVAPHGHAGGCRMWVIDGGKAEGLRTASLVRLGDLANFWPIGIFAVHDRLCVAVPAAPAAERSAVDLYENGAPRQAPWLSQPFTLDGKPFLWPTSNLPVFGRLADRPIVVWSDDSGLHYTLSDIGGTLNAAAAIPRKLPAQHGDEIRQYIIWGVLLLVMLQVFLIRPRPVGKPFSLPPTATLAHLAKRLLAGLLDLMPFQFAALAIMDPKAFALLATQPDAAVDPLVPLAGLVVYVAYCIAMEYRFGATIGKMVFHLHVVGDEGIKPDLRATTVRNMMKIIELSSGYFIVVFALFPVLTRFRQRLGDIMAHTTVVDSRTPPRP